MTTDHTNFIQSALTTLETEAAAIRTLATRLNRQFTQACDLLLQTEGRIVVTGMGKSGHIGNKIAATLASTGSPAFFVHPGEALHGDLGMITKQDVVLALSYSGHTQELVTLVPIVKRLGIKLISFTGDKESPLAQLADVNIDVGVIEEACPLGLAPTASTTATLAMGDALAIALLNARGFTAEDFARSHPGGSLGKRLLLHVSDIMHTDAAIPQVTPNTSLSKALVEITQKKFGMTIVVESNQNVVGIFTDGDLRRTLDKNIDIHQTTIAEVMTRNCRTIEPTMLAAEAMQIMEQLKITTLVVCDTSNQLVGIVHLHDLLQAGLS